MLTSRWAPVLIGRDSEAVQKFIGDIVRRLYFYDKNYLENNSSLSEGRLGCFVLAHYLKRVDFQGYRDLDSAALKMFLEREADLFPPNLGFFDGMLSARWALDQVRRCDLRRYSAHLHYLRRSVEFKAAKTSPLRFDLINGLAGLGAFLLHHADHPNARSTLALIVDRLDQWAKKTARGIAWFSNKASLDARSKHPCGIYDLGMAHGLAGVISFLAGARTAGIAIGQTTWLLEQSTSWLLSYEDRFADRGYPSFVSRLKYTKSRHQTGHLAWCYGDLGISISLILAGLALSSQEVKEAGKRIALRTLGGHPRWRPRVLHNQRRGLCHGSVGVGLIYQRIYHYIGDLRFREAAAHWYRATLALPDSRPGDLSLLAGQSGIALGLLAGLYPVEPEWDSFMMLSIPQASRTVRTEKCTQKDSSQPLFS